jgi:acetyl-CoA carboxylase, biotin carboxylase subunit
MFKKILIANRGEIALRIIRACKELGIATVAVHSEADTGSLHVLFADEDVCIGPADSTKSYLDIGRIVAAAEITGADAVHPGYGFLAESSRFARICEECNLSFIGPTGDMIDLLGDKAVAKKTMKDAGVPVVPGSDGPVTSEQNALDLADEFGYPIVLKAVSGGGGKGIRFVYSPDELKRVYEITSSEAMAAFGNGDLYLEKLVDNARHVEVQILGDTHGNIVHLGERDCTVQRRRQKLIEESPSSFLSPELRERITAAAVAGAKSVSYVNAGTVEFLVAPDRQFYFMEMNTRVQVEHPVTEMVTGVDVVKEQIRVAAGEPLGAMQKDISINGHSIECRINAEDPELDFRPGPGTIDAWHVPGGLGVRVDTHAFDGYRVPPFYDSMLAKLIVHAPSRMEAIMRMRRALDEFHVEGIPTTIGFHKLVMNDEVFINGVYDMSYVEKLMAQPES